MCGVPLSRWARMCDLLPPKSNQVPFDSAPASMPSWWSGIVERLCRVAPVTTTTRPWAPAYSTGSAPRGSMTIGRRFLIAGRVQGVGFQFFARSVATREGLSGTVANLADGRVEVRAEGDRGALIRFERALHQGPLDAAVHSVAVSSMNPEGKPSGFTICDAS